MTQNHKHQENLPIDDDHAFDLLADGELDEGRRRELLAGLDDRPGGWRQCALAFLEAQSWKREFGSLTKPPQPAATEAAKTEPAPSAPRRRRRSPGWVGTVLGMAASFLLAVGLTSLMRDMQRAGVPGLVPSGEMASVAGPGLAASKSTPQLRVQAVPKTPALRSDLQLVGLSAKDPSGAPRTVGLPAVPRQTLDEEWLHNTPTAIPEDVAQAFQRAGHEVRPSRQLLPFRMQDGRRLMVPVDQLDVHYVNNPTYQ